MTKNFLTSMTLGVGLFAFAASAQSQTTPSAPGKTDTPAAAREGKSGATKRATGDVTAVDGKSGKLTVRTSTEELNLDVQGTAKNSLGDIHVGDRVNISYEDKGGMLVANSISKASGSSKTGMESPGKGDRGSSASKVQ